MRGSKEVLGSIKVGSKSKSRATVSKVAAKSGAQEKGRKATSVEAVHGGVGFGGRKTAAGKGGTSK